MSDEERIKDWLDGQPPQSNWTAERCFKFLLVVAVILAVLAAAGCS